MAPISETDAKSRLLNLPGWELEGAALRRKFAFQGFAEAIAFIVRLGFDAEAVDHHPDILVNYKRVTLVFSTHSEGGLTQKDFDGARRASEIARTMGAA